MIQRSANVALACIPAAPARARQLVRDLLAAADVSQLSPLAELVVSELVTNAVIHTDCEELRVDVDLHPDGRLRIAVIDDDPAHLPAKPSIETSQIGGQGLHIVDAAAADWGVEATGGCKVVWVELPPAPKAR